MVEERGMTHRFQQDMSLEIQEHITITVMETYAEVLEAARYQEQATGRRKAEMGIKKYLQARCLEC